MGTRRGNRRGQSIIEYLVVAGVIIAAILFVAGGTLKTTIAGIMNGAQNKFDGANTVIADPNTMKVNQN